MLRDPQVFRDCLSGHIKALRQLRNGRRACVAQDRDEAQPCLRQRISMARRTWTSSGASRFVSEYSGAYRAARNKAFRSRSGMFIVSASVTIIARRADDAGRHGCRAA